MNGTTRPYTIVCWPDVGSGSRVDYYVGTSEGSRLAQTPEEVAAADAAFLAEQQREVQEQIVPFVRPQPQPYRRAA